MGRFSPVHCLHGLSAFSFGTLADAFLPPLGDPLLRLMGRDEKRGDLFTW